MEEGVKKVEEICDSVIFVFYEGCFEMFRYVGNGFDRFLFVVYVFEILKLEI